MNKHPYLSAAEEWLETAMELLGKVSEELGKMNGTEKHSCKEMDKHNAELVEDEGNTHGKWRIYKSHGVWRFQSGDQQWLIEYCPYCGVKL